MESSGPEVVELCASADVFLDPWQQMILRHGLGEGLDGRWAAFEVGEVLPRQNGKGDVLMARELGGLLILEEELILHTAHEFKTCAEAFRRIRMVIENCDGLRRKFKKPRMTTGQEALETLTGQRLLFVARSASSGRGFTGDCIILDEAQILTDDPVEAMLPTMSSIPNPQIWYAGTAGKQTSVHLGRVRRRAIKGGDPALCYLEWSVDEDGYDPADPLEWAIANPALGIRISADYVAKEKAAMGPEGFARERLGVGDWPTDTDFRVIPADKWAACADPQSDRPEFPLVAAVDISLDRSSAAIAIAGRRPDGAPIVEVDWQRPGVDWIAGRLAELVDKWQPVAVVVDSKGPAGTVPGSLDGLATEVIVPTTAEVAHAAERFYDSVMDGTLRHCGDPRLDAAVAGCAKRPLGDAWAWARRISTTDISPLVAASFALWGFLTQADGLGQPAAYVI